MNTVEDWAKQMAEKPDGRLQDMLARPSNWSGEELDAARAELKRRGIRPVEALSNTECPALESALSEEQPTDETDPPSRSMREILSSPAGRMRRSLFLAISIPLYFALRLIFQWQSHIPDGDLPVLIAFCGIVLVVFTIGITTQTMRFHDMNMSGWWCLMNLIPFLGALIGLLMLAFVPGTKGPNRFGIDPRLKRRRFRPKPRIEEPIVDRTDSEALKGSDSLVHGECNINVICPYCKATWAISHEEFRRPPFVCGACKTAFNPEQATTSEKPMSS